ncbi:hypothetical protein K435DRAFT_970406 [Dendrothele bispora CBS 962.96]|uniref:Uncharacterized protein n=1 Tax=Dendrothele bispora (strain CBS 962.96) TaxID=1314807 RepID=A0A4S8LBI3_DENBC|nr:hypothetical protein K435DRAFT_970406 [Dendrothele bispora CBS 962.96]
MTTANPNQLITISTVLSIVDEDLLDAGDLGVGLGDDGHRYWGTGEGLRSMELSENGLEVPVLFSYRSNLRLLYPPHLITIAATYLTLVLNPSAQATINHLLPSFSVDNAAESSPHPTEEPGAVIVSSSHFQSYANTTPYQSSCQSSQTQTPTQLLQTQDSTSRSLSLISTVPQALLSLYTL